MRTTTPSSLSKPPPEPVHHQGRTPPQCLLLTQSGHRGVTCSLSDHSGLMSAVRITFPHLSTSSAMNLRNSVGEFANARPPVSARRALKLGSARAALTS